MSSPLPPYSPKTLETPIYQRWLGANCFAPASDTAKRVERAGESFCIVIPPPNVTGVLHLGHAWDSTLQDILTRWMRMEGRNTLWLPGTDHAGIATQWMVERQLQEEGNSKEEIGREAFMERAWDFKNASHGSIRKQLECLGVSCDWSRERFTLDETLSKAVRRVFVQLYHEKLIYRGLRMVNWSPALRSAVSDLEVLHKEVKGHLWSFMYPFADGGKIAGQKGIVIATTRPETMLADGAVAVHPDDERYRAMVGKYVTIPLANRDIPIITDGYVKPEFGSGAVKISPAHDFNDFEVGQRAKLPFITVMDETGTMAGKGVPTPYQGLDRQAARKQMLYDLKAKGLLVKTETLTHSVGHCSRSGVTVEPRISEQWFVSVDGMAKTALQAVHSRQIELLPQFQEKIFAEWMENIHDWCISRQLWWGHQIPAWHCAKCQQYSVVENAPSVCEHCQSSQITQATDVLDTWFSSALWPFSTMGWPENTQDLQSFYPTSVLVTGYDILFFWVARMAMMGLKCIPEHPPFHQVLLHGLLRDEKGVKMSKTKGNGLDPVEVVEEYGADALRMALAVGTVLGQDLSLGMNAVEAMRNFANKLWNAARFVLGYRGHMEQPKALEHMVLSDYDTWLLTRLNLACAAVRQNLEQRRFNEAAKAVYAFVWDEFCDWGLEAAKPILNGQDSLAAQASYATLHHCLQNTLRLLHPFMPYVTEALWGHLMPKDGFVMLQSYPKGVTAKDLSTSQRETAQNIAHANRFVSALRTLRSENHVAPKARVEVLVLSESPTLLKTLDQQQTIVCAMAGASTILPVTVAPTQKSWIKQIGRGFSVYIKLPQASLQAQKARIQKDAAKLDQKITPLQMKLNNPEFVEKAPAAVVEKTRQKLAELQAQHAQLHAALHP